MRFSNTALLICDMQNDFLHPNGAYASAGLCTPEMTDLPARIRPFADQVRTAGGLTIATHFTLVPGRGGEPLISAHLKKLRPFLHAGDFAPNSWGQQTVDMLQPLDFTVEKLPIRRFT